MPGEPRSIARRALLAAAALTPLPTRAAVQDANWADRERGRELPLRIRWPPGAGPRPLLLYSHGLGGSREGAETWGRAWSEAGFVVVHLQHPGSDVDVWLRGLDALRAAGAGPGADRATSTCLRGPQPDPYAGPHEPGRAVRRGDEAVHGADRLARRRPFGAFAGGETRWRVFEGLPPGGRAGLWLDEAGHMSFAGSSTPLRVEGPLGRRDARAVDAQPRHQALIIALTTLWWQWSLRDDAAAARALARFDALGAADRWVLG